MSENSFSVQAPMTPTAALMGKLVPPLAEEASEAHMIAQERLAFRVGPIGMLIPGDAARELVLPPSVSRLPHLPVWLLGVANVRGMLLPVVDLSTAFGVEHDKQLRPYLLIVGVGEDAIGLLVDGLPLPRTLEAAERMSSIPPHPEFLNGHVTGGYERDGRVWLDTNVEDFIKTLGEHIAI